MSPLLLSAEQFFDVFETYNEAIWPAQLVLGVLALSAAIAAWKGNSVMPLFALGVLWLWAGLAYHLAYFTEVNPAAYFFALLFIAEGLIFLGMAALPQRRLSFAPRRNLKSAAGGMLLLYSLVLYPLIGVAFGHVYPAAPVFSAPCPTVVFTIGLLFWTNGRVPWGVLAVPLTWSLIGSLALLQWGVWQDLVMLVSALAAPFVLRSVQPKEALLLQEGRT